jgi:DNA-directed RNA polymerase specialized sigma24 family protein
MRRIDEIRHRLDRWQYWHLTTRLGGGAAVAWLQERVDCATPLLGMSPIRDDEVILTDMAVAQLREPLKRTVLTVYLDREGNSPEGLARILGVTQRTVDGRLAHADWLIRVWLGARPDTARAAAQRAAA